MKTIKRFLTVYIIFLSISIIIFSCCETTYQIIGNGTITAYDKETASVHNNNSTGIITGEFRIDVTLETIAVGAVLDLDVIQSAYATTCAEKYDNDIDLTTLKISTNKDFSFNERTIEQGSNLIDIEELIYRAGYNNISVDFKNEFFNQLEFLNEVYEFKIKVNTTDGLELENTISLKFEIE